MRCIIILKQSGCVLLLISVINQLNFKVKRDAHVLADRDAAEAYYYTSGDHDLGRHSANMKAVLLLAALSVLGVSQSAVVKAPLPAPDTRALRYNLNLGYISTGDRLLHRTYLYQPPIANTIQYQDFVYQGNRTTRITAIQVNEVGYTQYSVPSLRAGGIGYNNVTVRVQSARGYGYYYSIDIWGR